MDVIGRLKRASWRGWRGYAEAIAMVAVWAIFATMPVDAVIGGARFLAIAITVLVASALCGPGPGGLVLVACTAVGIALNAEFAANFPFRFGMQVGLLWLLSSAIVTTIALLKNSRRQVAAGERRTRESIEATERLAREFGLLIDSATNYAIHMLDPQGRVTIWNTGAERIAGWQDREILGQHCAVFYPAEDAAAGKPQADLQRAAEAGRLEEERWRVRRDGSEYLANVTATALYDSAGTLVGFGEVIRDITDQRAAESAIEAREMQLRSILETVPDAMLVVDDRGELTSFSATAERLFGYGAGEVLGSNVNLLMPPEGHEAFDGPLDRYLLSGAWRALAGPRRVLGRHRDGATFPLELAVGEAVGGGRRVYTGFIRDLTAKERTEARLQELQSELLHVSRLSAMGTMASTLAHELNQPLTAVANYLDAARDLVAMPRDDAIAGMLQEAVSEASAQAIRAGNIVRRLREFMAKGEVDKQVEPLAALVEEACVLGFAGARERGVGWQLAQAAGPVAVLVDRVQVEQVLINLMRNAVEALAEHGAAGGTVRVSTDTRPRSFVQVTVADNGPGLAPHVAQNLFGAFVSTKRDGLGLGLSICRTIVEAHGGRIWADSAPGEGTSFHFTLPRADTEQER